MHYSRWCADGKGFGRDVFMLRIVVIGGMSLSRDNYPSRKKTFVGRTCVEVIELSEGLCPCVGIAVVE